MRIVPAQFQNSLAFQISAFCGVVVQPLGVSRAPDQNSFFLSKSDLKRRVNMTGNFSQRCQLGLRFRGPNFKIGNGQISRHTGFTGMDMG